CAVSTNPEDYEGAQPPLPARKGPGRFGGGSRGSRKALSIRQHSDARPHVDAGRVVGLCSAETHLRFLFFSRRADLDCTSIWIDRADYPTDLAGAGFLHTRADRAQWQAVPDVQVPFHAGRAIY